MKPTISALSSFYWVLLGLGILCWSAFA